MLVAVMLVLAAKMVIAALPPKLRVRVQAELGRGLEQVAVVLQVLALTFAIQFAQEIRAARVAVLVLVQVSTVLV